MCVCQLILCFLAYSHGFSRPTPSPITLIRYVFIFLLCTSPPPLFHLRTYPLRKTFDFSALWPDILVVSQKQEGTTLSCIVELALGALLRAQHQIVLTHTHNVQFYIFKFIAVFHRRFFLLGFLLAFHLKFPCFFSHLFYFLV